MAARRLLLVMVVLLVASSLAAALVPIPDSAREESTSTTATTRPPTAAEPATRRLRADAKQPATIRTGVDERLVLVVTSRAYDQVEIPRLGLLEDVDPNAPARFDLLLDEPGTYPIRLVEADERIGKLEVSFAATATVRATDA